MTTVVDGLTDATTALNAAVQAILGLKANVTAQLAASLTQNAQVVADAVPVIRQWVVDPVNGSDTTGDGKSVATAYKTLKRVFEQAIPATKHLIYLTGDISHDYYSTVGADVTIRGSTTVPGTDGYLLQTARRRISFRPEALNSPLAGSVRATSAMVSIGDLKFYNVDLYIADVPAGVASIAHIIGSPRVSIDAGDIYGTTPGNAGRLVAFDSATPLSFFFYGAVAAAAQGRIFNGISPGANPNTGNRYVSNLTAN